MRILLLACMFAISVSDHAADRSVCKSLDRASEQSWNPSSAAVTPQLRHFYDLGHELEAVQSANDAVALEKIAREYLSAAEEYRCNWNYGNAIDDGNSALGLSALARHDKSQAVKYLLEAAKSPGSPQLDSFGPSMVLADKLVAAGEKEPVIDYLQGIHRFWRMDDGEVDKWIGQLKAGKHPDFRMQLL